MIAVLLFIFASSYNPITYDSYMAFNGLNYTQEIILLDCYKSIKFNKDAFKRFCNRAKWALGTPVNFCVRTGLRTKDKCVDIVKQRTYRKSVIRVDIFGELKQP